MRNINKTTSTLNLYSTTIKFTCSMNIITTQIYKKAVKLVREVTKTYELTLREFHHRSN